MCAVLRPIHLTPRLDGAILPQCSLQALPAALNRELGINQRTVATSRNRQAVEDLETGPREPHSSILTMAEEAMLVAFRPYMALALGGCPYALRYLSRILARSALHRCLER